MSLNWLFVVIIFCLIGKPAFAQLIPNFETTLKFYHYSGIIDSVNIGFSLNADDAYDSFDVLLDEDLQLPFSAGIFNPLIQNDYGNDTTCAYLKSNYLNFPEQTVTTSTGDIVKEWTIVFRSDDDFIGNFYNGFCSNPQQTEGLTLQVKVSDLFGYQFLNDQGYYIRYINLDGFNVFISGTDGYDQTFTISSFLNERCIEILRGDFGNPPNICQNNTDATYYAFKLKMAISNKFWTSIIDESNVPMININNNIINISSNLDFNLLKLHTINGQKIFNKKIEIGHSISTIDLKSFHNQLLILTLENTKSNKLYSTKLILK